MYLLPNLIFSELLEAFHLPADERVVVRVCVGGDEGAAPVYPQAKTGDVLHASLGEDVNPVVGIGEAVNLLSGDALGQHDLELVLGLGRLFQRLAILGPEFSHIPGPGLLLEIPDHRRRRLLLLLVFLVALKIEAKVLDLAHQLVGAGLDSHPGAVEAKWEEGALALHASVAGGEFDLGDGESMADVEAAIHIRVGDGTEELGLLGAESSRRDRVERDVGGAGGILFEGLVVSPNFLVLFLNRNQCVASLCL